MTRRLCGVRGHPLGQEHRQAEEGARSAPGPRRRHAVFPDKSFILTSSLEGPIGPARVARKTLPAVAQAPGPGSVHTAVCLRRPGLRVSSRARSSSSRGSFRFIGGSLAGAYRVLHCQVGPATPTEPGKRSFDTAGREPTTYTRSGNARPRLIVHPSAAVSCLDDGTAGRGAALARNRPAGECPVGDPQRTAGTPPGWELPCFLRQSSAPFPARIIVASKYPRRAVARWFSSRAGSGAYSSGPGAR